MDKWTSSFQGTTTKPMHHQPKLLNMEPAYGDEGTIITLVLQELLPCQTVKLAFNSLVVETRQLQSQGTTSLVANVPNFQTTLSTSSIVPISICYIEKEMIQGTIFVANFTYQSANNNNNNNNSIVSSNPTSTTIDSNNNDHPFNIQKGRKRSIVSFTNDVSMPNNKRLYQGITQDAFSNYLPSNNTYNHMPLSSYPYYQQKDDSSSPLPSYSQQPFPTTSISTSSTSTSASASSSPSSSPITSSSVQQQQQQPSSSQIRKSYHRPTVHSLKSTSHQPSTSVANYQPYPGLVSQNNLELVTDLDTMMQNWTSEECQQGRRLVRFWRQDNNQSNNNKENDDDVIRCQCEPISQQDPGATDTNNTVVSCIYCPDRNDYFITSVDCIYLLESLMNTHFGVEEKNRIRRNLEGFRPITVAKCKPKSADFFKLVMGFPHPKPRNIEKDIKAFTWKILPYALKKIIMKYTVTSSTSLSCNNNNNNNNRSVISVSSSSSSSYHPSNIMNSKNYSTYQHPYDSPSSVPLSLPPYPLSASSSATTNTSISSIISSNNNNNNSTMMNDDLHSISSSTDQSSNYYPYPNHHHHHHHHHHQLQQPSTTTSSPQLSDASPQLTYVSSSSPSSNQLQFMDSIIPTTTATTTITSFPIHSMPTATTPSSSSMMLPPPINNNFMTQLTTDNISPYDSNILTYSS